MEGNKKDHNNFHIAADMIIKWYEETYSTMIIAVHPKRNLDLELMRILLTAKKQTLGALTLLANNHILPTHALIRILSEIWVVLAWVLKPAKDNERANPDDAYKKLRRWDYGRLKKDIALLKELSRTPEIESAIKNAEQTKAKLDKDGIEELPNYQQMFRDLGDNPEEKKEFENLYAKIYRKYSRAVHLNRNVTQNFIQIKNEDTESAAMLYENDTKPDDEELISVICISNDINKGIRDFYGWHIKTIQNEYRQLEKMFINKSTGNDSIDNLQQTGPLSPASICSP